MRRSSRAPPTPARSTKLHSFAPATVGTSPAAAFMTHADRLEHGQVGLGAERSAGTHSRRSSRSSSPRCSSPAHGFGLVAIALIFITLLPLVISRCRRQHSSSVRRRPEHSTIVLAQRRLVPAPDRHRHRDERAAGPASTAGPTSSRRPFALAARRRRGPAHGAKGSSCSAELKLKRLADPFRRRRRPRRHDRPGARPEQRRCWASWRGGSWIEFLVHHADLGDRGGSRPRPTLSPCRRARGLLSFFVQVFPLQTFSSFLGQRAAPLLISIFFGPITVRSSSSPDRFIKVLLEATLRPISLISPCTCLARGGDRGPRGGSTFLAARPHFLLTVPRSTYARSLQHAHQYLSTESKPPTTSQLLTSQASQSRAIFFSRPHALRPSRSRAHTR